MKKFHSNSEGLRELENMDSVIIKMKRGKVKSIIKEKISVRKLKSIEKGHKTQKPHSKTSNKYTKFNLLE